MIVPMVEWWCEIVVIIGIILLVLVVEVDVFRGHDGFRCPTESSNAFLWC